MNKNNAVNIAHKADDFFVCDYHFTNFSNNNKLQPILNNFDCSEADIQSTSSAIKTTLFKANSQVYNKSPYHYDMYLSSKITTFATLPSDETTNTSITSQNSLSNINTTQNKVLLTIVSF